MVKTVKPGIAIFGGSFDPPHCGHQYIVNQALQILDIDRLFVVPAYLNPFKSYSLAPAALRLQWCKTLFDPIEKVEVSDFEINEAKSTYTSNTVKHFKQYYDVKYLIIGSDNLEHLTKWHEFNCLNEEVTWVIATRDSHHLHTEMLNNWVLLEIDVPISSSAIRSTKQIDKVDKKIQDSVKQLLEGQ